MDGIKIKAARILKFFILLLIPMLLFAFSTFITMKVILGGNEVKVPDLEGLPLEKARKIANKSRLKIKVIEERFSDSYEKGTVMKQYPYPNFKVKKGRTVKVIICSGKRKIVIPNLVGFSLFEAKGIIQESGLYLRNVSFTHYMDSEREVIIDQFPEPGTKDVETPYIDLLVSLPKREREYVMPDITGLPYKDVVFFLEKNGFILKPIDFELDFSHPSGIIIAQYPEKGVKIEWKSPITLVVSR